MLSLKLTLVFSISVTVYFIEISASGNSHLLIPCKPGWYLFGDKCYKILGLDKPLSWWMSSENCESEGGHLASIHSYNLQVFLTTFLQLNSKSDVWIGLHDRVTESDFSWDDNSDYNFTNWDTDEPFGIYDGQEEDCVEMRYYRYTQGIGTWNDAPCYYQKAFLCQVNKNGEEHFSDPRFCSLEYSGGWKYLDSCYHMVKEEKSWEDAEKYCTENLKGHVVTILDKNSEMFLNRILELSNLSKNVWIGIKMGNYSVQKWVTGWHVIYKGKNQEPFHFAKDTCVLKLNQTSWVVVPCLNKYPFICEIQKYNVPVLSRGHILGDWKCPNPIEKWFDLGGDSCYHVEYRKPGNWFKANDLCGRMGGSLASFHSEHESNILHHRVLNLPKQLWIGLRMTPEKDVYEWADGSKVNYQNWKEGEPNNIKEQCGELDTETMKWNDVPCSKWLRGYICKSKKVLSRKLKETPTSVPCNVTVLEQNFTEDGYQTYSGGITTGTAVAIVFCILFVVQLVITILYFSRKFWKIYFVENGNDGMASSLSRSLDHVSAKVIWKPLK